MRLFIAVTLPDEVRRALCSVGQEMGVEGIRWISEENIHLTLKFLGEIPDADLPVVTGLLSRAASEESPFEMSLRGLGVLPGLSRPRIVYARVEAPPALQRLAEKIDPAFESLGVAAERRPFLPHVTIGRSRASGGRGRRRSTPVQGLEEGLARYRDVSFGGARVSTVVLFESVLDRSGATHTPLMRAPLG